MTTTATRTNWTQATTLPIKAIAGLLSALDAGLNAWIEVQENGKQDYPVMIKNPALDNPFNWTMMFGVPTEPEYNHQYFNETEKDLTLNYTACYGESKAIELYQQTGEVTKGLSKGIGICNPVKKSDLLKLRPDLKGVNLWTTHWTPIDGIPYRVADPSIKKVYVVCTSDGPADKDASIKSAIGLLESLL